MFDPKKLKVAVLHAFFKSDCKGGGEKLVFALRDYYKADLVAGAIDLENWNIQTKPNDSFVKALWDKEYRFQWLHRDSKKPIWRKIKRQLAFAFSPIINELNNYDVVFFSGNIALAQGRISKPKKILYCHTTPRPFTDQLPSLLASKPALLRPLIELFAKWVVWQYTGDCKKMDLIISNSENIQNRLKEYTGLDSKVIYPAVNTNRFKWLGEGDYFISFARLEEIKRIKVIVNAFASLPDQKLVICSAGPLKDWILNKIEDEKLTNIVFKGLVSDEELAELVGRCRAGIYIPVNEDAGITQIEIMAAGKPVIGVNEGALPHTVLHEKTGLIINENPKVEDLVAAIQKLDPKTAISMKEKCESWSKGFDESVFFEKMNQEIELLIK